MFGSSPSLVPSWGTTSWPPGSRPLHPPLSSHHALLRHLPQTLPGPLCPSLALPAVLGWPTLSRRLLCPSAELCISLAVGLASPGLPLGCQAPGPRPPVVAPSPSCPFPPPECLPLPLRPCHQEEAAACSPTPTPPHNPGCLQSVAPTFRTSLAFCLVFVTAVVGSLGEFLC